MKKHKLDKLFADKLDGLQSAPAPEAWEKLAESLEQPRKPYLIWIGVAASAILAIFSSWYMLSTDSAATLYDYTYAKNQTEDVDIPKEIVLVPVFIRAPSNNTIVEEKVANPKNHVANNDKGAVELIDDQPQTNLTLANNKVFEHQLTPVLKDYLPVPDDETKEVIMASSKETITEEDEITLDPLTIIYKKGEPEPVSNFTKAINFMEDVRNGDKKLVNLKKIGDNIRSKIKSNKDVNSK